MKSFGALQANCAILSELIPKRARMMRRLIFWKRATTKACVASWRVTTGQLGCFWKFQKKLTTALRLAEKIFSANCAPSSELISKRARMMRRLVF
jgi:hypothetical protein